MFDEYLIFGVLFYISLLFLWSFAIQAVPVGKVLHFKLTYDGPGNETTYARGKNMKSTLW